MKVVEDDDRFGVTPELIRRMLEEHRGIIRMGCYVPTREEVATADPAWLEGVLSNWWWESPEALIPTYGQVRDVMTTLKGRPDAESEAIQRIIADAPTDEDFG